MVSSAKVGHEKTATLEIKFYNKRCLAGAGEAEGSLKVNLVRRWR